MLIECDTVLISERKAFPVTPTVEIKEEFVQQAKVGVTYVLRSDLHRRAPLFRPRPPEACINHVSSVYTSSSVIDKSKPRRSWNVAFLASLSIANALQEPKETNPL